MPCETVRGNLWLYAAEELGSGERRETERHLDGCASCRAELAEMKRIIASMPRRAPMSEAELELFASKTLARMEERAPALLRLRPRWAAATAALFIATGSLFYYESIERSKMDEIYENLELLQNLDELEDE